MKNEWAEYELLEVSIISKSNKNVCTKEILSWWETLAESTLKFGKID